MMLMLPLFLVAFIVPGLIVAASPDLRIFVLALPTVALAILMLFVASVIAAAGQAFGSPDSVLLRPLLVTMLCGWVVGALWWITRAARKALRRPLALSVRTRGHSAFGRAVMRRTRLQPMA